MVSNSTNINIVMFYTQVVYFTFVFVLVGIYIDCCALDFFFFFFAFFDVFFFDADFSVDFSSFDAVFFAFVYSFLFFFYVTFDVYVFFLFFDVFFFVDDCFDDGSFVGDFFDSLFFAYFEVSFFDLLEYVNFDPCGKYHNAQVVYLFAPVDDLIFFNLFGYLILHCYKVNHVKIVKVSLFVVTYPDPLRRL